jgi:hypothetical protein
LQESTWLWDAESGKEVARIAGTFLVPSNGMESFPFSVDGSLLLTFDRASASLWNAASGERLATFQDGLPLDVAALSADGSTVLTWSGLSGLMSSSARVWPAVLTIGGHARQQ